MSYWVDTEIKELKLRIPKKDLPLKSDIIVGFESPKLVYPDDECSTLDLEPSREDNDYIYWEIDENNDDGIFAHDSDGFIDELIEIVKTYKGTLIADSQGEETSDREYYRIRDGIQKKVRVIEEEDEE